jgi:hypothetical protein
VGVGSDEERKKEGEWVGREMRYFKDFQKLWFPSFTS